VHFKCIKCHETSCLDQVHIPAFDLPLGFIAKEIGILVQGVCDQCAKS
jgi:Fur family ferric uptake transcriptional regulator